MSFSEFFQYFKGVVVAAGAAAIRQTMAGAAFASGTLVDGTAVDVPMAGAPMPCTIAISPVSGDTVTYSYTIDGVNYTERAAVTIYTEDVLDAPVLGMRFERTAGAGVTSTWAIV